MPAAPNVRERDGGVLQRRKEKSEDRKRWRCLPSCSVPISCLETYWRRCRSRNESGASPAVLTTTKPRNKWPTTRNMVLTATGACFGDVIYGTRPAPCLKSNCFFSAHGVASCLHYWLPELEPEPVPEPEPEPKPEPEPAVIASRASSLFSQAGPIHDNHTRTPKTTNAGRLSTTSPPRNREASRK